MKIHPRETESVGVKRTLWKLMRSYAKVRASETQAFIAVVNTELYLKFRAKIRKTQRNIYRHQNQTGQMLLVFAVFLYALEGWILKKTDGKKRQNKCVNSGTSEHQERLRNNKTRHTKKRFYKRRGRERYPIRYTNHIDATIGSPLTEWTRMAEDHRKIHHQY